MNRFDFQVLAEERVEDAKALLVAGRHGAAYYLCGYAVECALKAWIAKGTREHDFPPRDSGSLYTHKLSDLLDKADSARSWSHECQINPDLERNWALAKDWNERARYDVSVTLLRAQGLFQAVTDPLNGVLTCLRRYW
ncbi:MAG: DNA-binding protein [Bryobacteraceae bacterium]